MSAIRDAAAANIADGLLVVPLRRSDDGKACLEKDWSKREFAVEDFSDDVTGVGVRPGGPKSLEIIDVDDPKLAPFAKRLLPKTRTDGRRGKDPGHFLYSVPDGLKRTKYKNVDDSMLIEVLSTHAVLPPSPSLDGPRYWVDESPISTETADVLDTLIRQLATIAILGRNWPGTGSRHDAAKYAAGFLAQYLEREQVEDIVRYASEYAGDKEVEDRVRAARDTVRNFETGGKTKGAPSLADLLGQAVVDRLREWFKTDDRFAAVIDEMNQHRFKTRMGKDTVYGLEQDGDIIFQKKEALFEEYVDDKIKVGERTITRGARKGQTEAEFKSKFEIWREHPRKRKYRQVTFAPPPVKADPLDYNLWRGFAVSPIFPENISSMSEEEARQWADDVCLPKCQRFFDLVRDVICSGNEEHYAYIVRWLAFTVQYPGVPIEVALVLLGGLGTGKGTFARTVGSLFGRHFIQLDKREHVTGKFNSSMSAKVIVFADEAFFAGDKKDLGSLKRLITEPTLAIERKGIDVVSEANFTHLIMATNDDHAIQAGMKERRYLPLKVSDLRQQDHAYFDRIVKEMDHGGREALLSYLLTRQVTHDQVRGVPRTGELATQQEHSLPAEMKWWKERLYVGAVTTIADPHWPDEINTGDLHDDYLRWCEVMKVNRRVSAIDLGRRVLKPWLGKARLAKTGPHRDKNVRALLPLLDARALFDAHAGVQTEWEGDEGEAPRVPDTEGLPF